MSDNLLTLWKSPVPATDFSRRRFVELPRRVYQLQLEFEDDDGTINTLLLNFEGVEMYQCTHEFACTAEMITSAYGRVTDLGPTALLTGVKDQIATYGSAVLSPSHAAPADLRHLRIYFDGGPCYDFICGALRTESIIENEPGQTPI